MLRAVVQNVTALAPGGEVAGGVDARIVVPVRSSEVDAGLLHRARDLCGSRLCHELPATIVAPATVAEVQDDPAVRSPALLTVPLGADEPDLVRELWRIDRVERSGAQGGSA